VCSTCRDGESCGFAGTCITACCRPPSATCARPNTNVGCRKRVGVGTAKRALPSVLLATGSMLASPWVAQPHEHLQLN
jgi:hypothetical protein